VVCADAGNLVKVAKGNGFIGEGCADAVISGLGLLSMPRQAQQGILKAAFDCLRPDGRFIQFTYGPANPVIREVVEALELTARRASFTWWNVPPATVYVLPATGLADHGPAFDALSTTLGCSLRALNLDRHRPYLCRYPVPQSHA
jgi:hypothetical protein